MLACTLSPPLAFCWSPAAGEQKNKKEKTIPPANTVPRVMIGRLVWDSVVIRFRLDSTGHGCPGEGRATLGSIIVRQEWEEGGLRKEPAACYNETVSFHQ